MSAIEEFYKTDSYLAIERQQLVSGTRISSGTIVTSGNRYAITCPGKKSELFKEDNMGKEYHIFCNIDVDAKVGDIAILYTSDISSGARYGIASVSPMEDLEDDEESHLEIIGDKK